MDQPVRCFMVMTLAWVARGIRRRKVFLAPLEGIAMIQR